MRAEDYADLYALEDSFWWFAGMREITGALLDPVCPPSEDRLILDAGCGTGGMLSWLKRYAGRGKTIGIDLVPHAIRYCLARGHRHLLQASATSLPFHESAFDLVTSFDVLTHLVGEESDAQALREMLRVLRPGGIAFVRVAAYRWLRSDHDEAIGTERRYTLDELIEKMQSAGFIIVRASYANGLLLPVAVLRRLLLKRIGLSKPGSDVKPLPSGLSWLNRPLAGVLRGEAFLLRRSGLNMRMGLSAICVAQKPEG